MSNLIKHATIELNLIQHPHPEGILKILETISNQEHSGFSISYTKQMINNKWTADDIQNLKKNQGDDENGLLIVEGIEEIYNLMKELNISKDDSDKLSELLDWKLLSPLTYKEDEWRVSSSGKYQNIRCSSVFKECKNGRPYKISAFYLRNEDGDCYSGSLRSLNGGLRLKRCYVKDSMNMPQIQINVINDNYATIEELNKLSQYYDIEFWEE